MHRLLLVGLFALLLAACASEPTPTETPEPTFAAPPTATPTQPPPPTAEPTDVPPTATPPLPTPTAEPIRSQIEAADQMVGDDGLIRIARVVSAEKGWLTLTSSNINLLTISIEPGTLENIEATVDPLLLGSTARLQLFAGDGDTFDPEVHAPMEVDGTPVEASIAIDLQITTPQIVMLKQEVFEDGIVIAESVVATEAGWLAIHNDNNGELGEVVGFYVVRGAGVYARVPVPITWRTATPTLHAVLYGDGGEIGRFEPEIDPIIRVQDSYVQAQFDATYPPDIFIINQPVLSNTVIVERVISNGPGWLTIMFETAEETPGNIIGFAPLQDGVNEYVQVELVPGAATPVLYAQQHVDDAPLGEFDFPGGDLPTLYKGQTHTFFFNTDIGNYILSADQSIQYEGGIATVTVPMAVVDLDAWVVIRAELAEGILGNVLGYASRSAGIHRDIVIEIDAENATETLYATLHIDRPPLQVFEFPDGLDFELQRRRAPIASPFVILP